MNPIVLTLITIGVALGVTLTMGAYASWAERKLAALFQQRKGPNRVGPFGLLQPVADVLKLLIKEDITPKSADKWGHFIAPIIAVTCAFMIVGAIPFAQLTHPDGSVQLVAVADLGIGVLYLLTITSIAVYSVSLAGWSSNNKYSLMGGLRASAQMVSYELAMGLAVVSVILLTNFRTEGGASSLNVHAIVEAQRGGWNILVNPLGFLIFLICAFAEAKRAPFDLIEAEQELVGGYHTEFSSMRFGMFMLVEFLEPIISGMVLATLWLGGYLSPFDDMLGVSQWNIWLQLLWGVSWLIGKIIFFFILFSWVRWTIPRFKYNQLMDIGWKRMLPLALINLVIIATVIAVLS